MARIRTIKPDFFRHEGLFQAERDSGLPLRIAFAGLWTAADREGRFRWAPRALKLDCLPYDDLDFAAVLSALAAAGFIVKYVVGGSEYGLIPSWRRHQHINAREAKSDIPDENQGCIVDAGERTCVHDNARGEGKGREGKGREGKGREGKGREKDAADAALAGASTCTADPPPSGPPQNLEVDLFRRGKGVLGANAGGLIRKLLAAKEGNIPLARAAVEQASTKQDPREYIGRIIRGHDPPNGSAYYVDPRF